MMRQIFYITLLIFPLLYVTGCAPTVKTNDPVSRPFEKGAYQVGTGDMIRVTVYGQEEITGEYSVDDNGNLSLPLIQNIKAENKTLDELSETITNALQPKYLQDPKVSLEVIEYRDIYVLGEVRNPGKFPYIPNMTVLQSVAVAGGHTYRANEDFVEITRKEEDGLKTFRLPAKAFVRPGDTIIVKRRWF